MEPRGGRGETMSAIADVTGRSPALRSALRLLVATVAAGMVTLGLYLLMAELVAAGREALTDNDRGRIVDFVRISQKPELQTEDRKPEKPERPEDPPPEAPAPETESQAPTAGAVNIGSMGVSSELTGEGFRLSASDGEYLPIVQVAPSYPRRAQQRGTEGYVLLEFTVTAQGRVADPRVIESEPSDVFDRAALDAVKRYRYEPRVQDGEPVAVEGVQHLITFEID